MRKRALVRRIRVPEDAFDYWEGTHKALDSAHRVLVSTHESADGILDGLQSCHGVDLGVHRMPASTQTVAQAHSVREISKSFHLVLGTPYVNVGGRAVVRADFHGIAVSSNAAVAFMEYYTALQHREPLVRLM